MRFVDPEPRGLLELLHEAPGPKKRSGPSAPSRRQGRSRFAARSAAPRASATTAPHYREYRPDRWVGGKPLIATVGGGDLGLAAGDVKSEGYHVRIPYIERPIYFDVRTRPRMHVHALPRLADRRQRS